MPELPDVEGERRRFRRHAAGKTVRGVSADASVLRNTTPQALGRALSGQRLGNPERHGKWLRFSADERILLLHFGMTGTLVWSGAEPKRHDHDRIVLDLGDGELRYRNQRKLGGAWMVRDEDQIREVTGDLGPDAFRVSKREFLERVGARRGGIKAALMDQTMVAGLGNITVDEILFQARIHPRRDVSSLSEKDLARVERTTKRVLRDSVSHGQVPSKRTWLTGRRDEKDPACPRCKGQLKKTKAAGRTTYFCPSCQE